MSTDLLELALANNDLADLDAAERRLALRGIVAPHVEPHELASAVERLSDEIDGFGPLGPWMRDEAVTDVLVNGGGEVWVERAGMLERVEVSIDRRELYLLIERLLSRAGARADLARPIADARLHDGSRIHVVLPPLAPVGPLVSIRRFPRSFPSLEDLVTRDMLSTDQAAALAECVRARRSLLISGATGAGKTTLLNALLACVPESERITTIEELPELRPHHPHVVSLVARGDNIESTGAIGLDELVRAALRMRPDRVVVGEVRGPEAFAALSALSTGHEGSLLTVHAHSADDALDRLITLALTAGSGASERALERQATRAVHVIVQVARRGASRRVVAIEDVE